MYFGLPSVINLCDEIITLTNSECDNSITDLYKSLINASNKFNYICGAFPYYPISARPLHLIIQIFDTLVFLAYSFSDFDYEIIPEVLIRKQEVNRQKNELMNEYGFYYYIEELEDE